MKSTHCSNGSRRERDAGRIDDASVGRSGLSTDGVMTKGRAIVRAVQPPLRRTLAPSSYWRARRHIVLVTAIVYVNDSGRGSKYRLRDDRGCTALGRVLGVIVGDVVTGGSYVAWWEPELAEYFIVKRM